MLSNFEEKKSHLIAFYSLKTFSVLLLPSESIILLLRPFFRKKTVFDERHLSSFFSFLPTSSSFSLFSPSALKGHQDLLLLRCLVFVVYVDFKFPLTDSLEHEKANDSFFLCLPIIFSLSLIEITVWDTDKFQYKEAVGSVQTKDLSSPLTRKYDWKVAKHRKQNRSFNDDPVLRRTRTSRR